MRVRSIAIGESGEPETITAELTLNEAALLYALTGHTAPVTVTNATGDVRWGNALDDIASCLSSQFFNRFWEAGAAAVAPRGLRVVSSREVEQ